MRVPDEPVAGVGSRLFRVEALAARQDGWLGSVLIVPQMSHSLAVAGTALMLACLAALLVFGTHTQTVRLEGWLHPAEGLVAVVAPRAGTLASLTAREGLTVRRGTPLAVIAAAEANATEIVGHLQARISRLEAERTAHAALFAQEDAVLNERLVALDEEVRSLARERDLQAARRALAEATSERLRDLRDREIATTGEVHEAEDAVLAARLALESVERASDTARRERDAAEATRNAQPLRRDLQLSAIDRDIAALRQELAEAEAARETVVTAPVDGTVTALRGTTGAPVVAGGGLLTIVPDGTSLVVRVDAPGRAIGLVRPGQRVVLRYEAFPHRIHGRREGIVRSVSRAPVDGADLSDETSPSSGGESEQPLYRVVVEPIAERTGSGEIALPLQPGMAVDADVVIGKRSILDWIVGP